MTSSASPSLRPTRLNYLSRHLWRALIFFFVYTLIALWVELNLIDEDLTTSSDMQTVASLFLGTLMALRINSSYNKWWEARTLWGRLVNDERNIAAYIGALARVPREAKSRVRDLLIEFPTNLMHHLREPASVIHAPVAISARLFSEIQEWRRQEWIDGWEWSRLAVLAEGLLAVCGGCERIRSSPLIRSYHLGVLICIWIYLFAAPLALHCRPWTVPLVMLLATLFLTFEQIATDIDQPFGTDPDDLPLERLCLTIDQTVSQLLPGSAPGEELP